MRWRDILDPERLLRLLRSALFVARCPVCAGLLVEAGERILCSDCRAKIRPATDPACLTCGAFIPEGLATCGSCLLSPPPFHRHRSYAAYDGVLREAILLYKFREMEPLKHLLAGLFWELLQPLGDAFAAVVPVPADRRRRRRFRPVADIGRLLARRLGVPFRPGLLVKKKSTRPQVGLTRAQRLANLDGAFALAAGARVRGQHLLLIDDVTTTGTTLRKCSWVLRRGGARVTALTLAQSRF